MKKLLYLVLGCLSIIVIIFFFLPTPQPAPPPPFAITSIPSWSVTLPKTRPQRPDTYDAIVVGGGFGGLTCGALLAKEGYRILVLEKNEQLGGYGSNDYHSGYTFSYGAQDISGVWERGCVSYLLAELGLDERKLLVRNTRRFILNGEAIDIEAVDDGFEMACTGRFPSQHDEIHAFFTDAKKVYLEAFDKEMIRAWGVPLHKELLPKAMPKGWANTFATTHPLLGEWQRMTYREVLDTYFQQEEIKTLLCSMLGYIGARAAKSSALSVVVASGYFFFGGHHIVGGSQHLAEVLARYITEHGGVVLNRHPVESIVVKGGAVEGVIVNHEEFIAPVVISNVNAKTLYLDLVPNKALPEEFRTEIQNLPMGRSAFLVFLGCSQTFPTYPTIINDLDHRVHTIIASHDDHSLAPLADSSICIEQSAQMKDFPSPHSLEYDLKVATLMNEMIEKATLSLPGLADHVVFKKAIAPREFKELTAIPEGAIYCFDQSSVPVRPYFKAPIRGLYLANASSSGEE